MLPTRPAVETHLGALLIMVFVIVLMGQFGHQLWTPDEPREAAIAWEMFNSRELAIPTLAGSSFIEKPRSITFLPSPCWPCCTIPWALR